MNSPIAPYELMPDYVWLASARIVVEDNLWEAFELSEDPNAFSMGDVLPLLRKMHITRLGGSPGYWNGWAMGVRGRERVRRASRMKKLRDGIGRELLVFGSELESCTVFEKFGLLICTDGVLAG